jgi:ribonuclease E
VATCAEHVAVRAHLEGKSSMSEPLLGEAATFGPQPAPTGDGGGGEQSQAPQPDASDIPVPEWVAGQEPEPQDLAANMAAGALIKTRRRRRGSRGGRGRHGANGSVDASEDGQYEDEADDDVADGGAPPPVARTEGRDEVAPPPPRRPPAPVTNEGATSPATGSPATGSAATGSPATGSPAVGSPAPGPLATGSPAPTAIGSPAPTATGSPLLSAPATPASVKPKIGDTRPGSPPAPKRRSRKEPVGPRPQPDGGAFAASAGATDGVRDFEDDDEAGPRARRQRRRKGQPEDVALTPIGRPPRAGGVGAAAGRSGPGASAPLPAAGVKQGVTATGAQATKTPRSQPADRADRLQETTSRRGAAERRARPLGRYLMVVHVGPTATQIAVLEGRTLIEHYVSRPADDATQIDGNIYLGRVQNVLPGMEAAFVDIGTPKNAVLYRGDLRYDEDEVGPAGDDDHKPTRGRLGGAARDARIEQLLRTGQNIICQVTKNPIGTKGARLTQEVSLPGRFVVLIPDSDTYGISKRLGDDERRRLRKILDDIRPAGHGLIVRTAAEGASADELGRDVARLLRQWENVQQLAKSSRAPHLLYREPDLAVRVIREEFNRDYRGVVIDDARLYEQVKEYVASITPELADRVELVDTSAEPLPLFERFRVHEQVHKALDRKVWLPSGGSLIIERTEALTVIDVNTGKNVGTSNLEETVFRNNLEAAEEIARQLRLRDIGGIIVIDFIDMEILANRAEVIKTFREALARDKTRSQVFDISELGLVEMTRKRISEGLVESYSETCPTCAGRGIVFDESLL